MDPRRAERVSEALREELEEMIGYELEDPRIQAADVVEVLMSPDAKQAHIRLKIAGDQDSQIETLAALEHARHYLRRELAQRLDLFRMPELHFEAAIDPGLSPKVNKLMRRIRRGRPRGENGEPPAAKE
jgi:ribosome-binding factor A